MAREHNNAQLIGIGGRMHTVEEALAIVDAFLSTPWSKAERHQRRIDILAEYERTHAHRRCRARRPSVPEGHTLHRLARLHQRKFGGQPVGVSSPQGRFADGAAMVNGRVLRRASAYGKHLFHHYERRPDRACASRVVRRVHRIRRCRWPLPGREVRMRMVGADFGTDLRGPTACEVIDEAQVDDVLARLGPDPLRTRCRPGAGVEANHASRRGRLARC